MPDISVTKPTQAEKVMWRYIHPRKTGGLIRLGAAKPLREILPCAYGLRDKTNPEHWNCKMKGGPRAEWWAVMMEGARRILDVGCGFGYPSFYLASCGYDVVGVDPSPEEIETAERYRQEEGPGYSLGYQVIEQTDLPFDDNIFDGATFSGSIACAGDPEKLISEVKRVLKPGSRVAFDEEDRSLEPKTHPVSEQEKIIVIDGIYYLWLESRINDPYLDRRYLVRLSDGFQPVGEPSVQFAVGSYLSAETLEEAGFTLEQVLDYAVDAEYGEALGYDPYTLRAFLEKMGFTNLKYWTVNDGRIFAEELKASGALSDMPDDIRAVSRALIKSIRPLSTPTTLVSCIS